MFKKLIQTDSDIGTLALRVLLGIVLLPHGLQKTVAWFGGYGFSGTMGFFTGTLGIPALFAFFAIAAEFLGSLGLIFGFFTRIAAFGTGLTITVAALLLHVQNGFFMNWFGNQKGEGIEYHIPVIAIAVTLMIRGGGALSADRVLAKQAQPRNQVCA